MFDPEGLPHIRKKQTLKLFSAAEMSSVIDEKITPVEPLANGGEKMNPLVALSEVFPTIASRIISFWGKPQLEEYLTGLSLMDRANRNGFSKAAMSYVLDIWSYCEVVKLGANDDHDCPWMTDRRLLKHLKKDDIEAQKDWRYGGAKEITGKEALEIDLANLQTPPPMSAPAD